MDIKTMKEFASSNNVTAISNVRTNTNGYPYLTMLSDKFEGGAENFYFSKRAAAKVSKDQTPTAIGLGQLSMAVVKNAAGEQRIKICTAGEDYTSVSELW